MAHVSEPRPNRLGTALSIVGVLLALGAMFVAAEHSQAMKVTFLMVAACVMIVGGWAFLQEALRKKPLERTGLGVGTFFLASGILFLFKAFQTDSDLALTSLLLIVLVAATVTFGYIIRKGKITTR